ncbi:MAG TPA: HRDC domain-containing protein [Anaerolineales bacterium]|nr:HRDC domain-containing protein [Anaerolineales bacterium]
MAADLRALPTLIETPERFAVLSDDLRRQERVAVDTESNSLHAYKEKVCLIQFSTADTDYVLDPLAVRDIDALGSIFADPSIEKIFHASEYDIICLSRDYKFTFASLFDTMQSGRILGRRQAGLDRLLEEKFGVKMNKRFQKADWAVRPLSRELLMYARLDTHYLIPLRDMLQKELEERGLWQLAQEDFRLACQPNGSKPRTEIPAWSRFSTRRDLTARDLTVLDSLLTWRDGVASELDRPPFKVLDDDHLIEIALAKPSTTAELAANGLTARQVQTWGEPILHAVGQGTKRPPVKPYQTPRPNDAYLKRLDKLKDWRKKTAAKMDVESDVVLPRPLLLSLAEKGPQEAQSILRASPWRLEHFGDQVIKVLGG